MLLEFIILILIIVSAFIFNYYLNYSCDKDLKKMYIENIRYYGKTNQKNRACEELEALQLEICNDIIQKGENEENVIEGLANVCNMINQLMIIYNIDKDYIQYIMSKKMKCQIKRIEVDKKWASMYKPFH